MFYWVRATIFSIIMREPHFYLFSIEKLANVYLEMFYWIQTRTRSEDMHGCHHIEYLSIKQCISSYVKVVCINIIIRRF